MNSRHRSAEQLPLDPDIAGIDYSTLPHHLQEGLRLHIEEGVATGGFLHGVLCNKLDEAFSRADPESWAGMEAIMRFLFDQAPQNCWGSPERVAEWCMLRKQKRLF